MEIKMYRIFIGLALVFVTVLADDSPIVPNPPIQPSNNNITSTTLKPTTTTSEKPSSTTSQKPTTSSSTTTSEKPSTTSEKPSTTSEKPSTTSEKPSSTTDKPTSTTQKPTTTSTEKPTTPAPAPTPVPNPDQVPVWNVTENKATACILASMKIAIHVPYVNETGTVHENKTRVFFVPNTASASGNCGNSSQSLKLTWTESNTTLNGEFVFKQNKTTGFSLDTVQFVIPAVSDLFPGIAANHTNFTLISNNASLPPTPATQSFKCFSGVSFPVVDSNPNHTVATINLTHVQFEAFANATGNKFGAPVECIGDQFITPDIVPIAVGVALAALVAVVLVAYVIGRRRSNASGYMSM